MCGVFVIRVVKSSLLTLTVTLWYFASKAFPSASNKGTSGVETRMFRVAGAVPMAVVAAVGEAPADVDLAPGAQAATARTADAIPMASAAWRRLSPQCFWLILIATPLS